MTMPTFKPEGLSLKEIREMKDRGEIEDPSKNAKPIDLPEDFWEDAETRHPENT